MVEPRTQLSAGDISIDASHGSLVVSQGASEAATKVRAKPRFIDFMCGSYEVECYVKAVVLDVIPRDFWGSEANSKLVLSRTYTNLRTQTALLTDVNSYILYRCVRVSASAQIRDDDGAHPTSALLCRGLRLASSGLGVTSSQLQPEAERG